MTVTGNEIESRLDQHYRFPKVKVLAELNLARYT
jgi:hypothetical protein